MPSKKDFTYEPDLLEEAAKRNQVLEYLFNSGSVRVEYHPDNTYHVFLAKHRTEADAKADGSWYRYGRYRRTNEVFSYNKNENSITLAWFHERGENATYVEKTLNACLDRFNLPGEIRWDSRWYSYCYFPGVNNIPTIDFGGDKPVTIKLDDLKEKHADAAVTKSKDKVLSTKEQELFEFLSQYFDKYAANISKGRLDLADELRVDASLEWGRAIRENIIQNPTDFDKLMARFWTYDTRID